MHDAELKRHLDHLATLGAPDLRAEWAKVYGRPAPRRISRDLLLRGIAYRLQEQIHGGLKPATIRKLRKIVAAVKGGADLPAPTAPALKSGVRLLRDWNGETHIVEVVPGGFAWRGGTYRSLTMITRLITGVSWSGPKFFGLRDKRGRKTAAPSELVEHLR